MFFQRIDLLVPAVEFVLDVVDFALDLGAAAPLLVRLALFLLLGLEVTLDGIELFDLLAPEVLQPLDGGLDLLAVD